jgi:helix-turn-helix protein
MNAPPPTLDLVARDPDCLAGQPSEVLVKLMAQIAAAQSAVVARLLAPATGATKAEPDEMLTVQEASKLIRRDRQWIWRHKKSLPFVKQISGKSLLVSKNGLESWLASRRLNT